MTETKSNPVTTPCAVYRCGKQDQMYLYLRAGFDTAQLPEALRKRAGPLHHVMDLSLSPERRLARVDVEKVIERLLVEGWYLQLPPDGNLNAHLYFGD